MAGLQDQLSGLLGQAYVDPRQGMMSGAAQAVSPYMGYTKTPTSIGQVIAAAGGGVQKGRMDAISQNAAIADIRMKLDAAAQSKATAEMEKKLYGGMPKDYFFKLMDQTSPTTALKNYNESMKSIPVEERPTLGEWMTEQKRAGSTKVSVSNVRETAEEKARGEAVVARETAVGEKADNARQTMAYTGMARTMLTDPQIQPTAFGTMIGSFASYMGVPMTDEMAASVTSGQGFTAMMGNILAAKLAAQKGPQTDKDANRMEKTLATLGDTPAARTFLLDASDALSLRDIEQEQFYDQWREDHGSIKGAKKAWNDLIGNVPLFGVNPKDNVPVFYTNFRKDVKAVNKDAKDADIRDLWVKTYAG